MSIYEGASPISHKIIAHCFDTHFQSKQDTHIEFNTYLYLQALKTSLQAKEAVRLDHKYSCLEYKTCRMFSAHRYNCLVCNTYHYSLGHICSRHG